MPSWPTSRTTPSPTALADGDIEIGLGNNAGNSTPDYDNELLDAHFIAGDGRVNENIGLTAVHHVFHAEHNRLAEHTKDACWRQGTSHSSTSGSCQGRRIRPDAIDTTADR